MPRANRFFFAGAIWHLTHRCHDRQFLLKFERDRLRWKHWLFEARKRFGLVVLNYIATSNHVHLLVRDSGRNEIAKSMQLIASRTAQEYNRRKSRKGAFWEDRYFATAISADQHFLRCLVYIDLNMIRAGAVAHPGEWRVCGYNEIQQPPDRYRIIDRQELQKLTSLQTDTDLMKAHQRWVAEAMCTATQEREPIWTDSIAVGSEEYVGQIKSLLGGLADVRLISAKSDNTFCISEPDSVKQLIYGPKSCV